VVLVANGQGNRSDFLLLTPFALIRGVALPPYPFQHLIDQHTIAGKIGLLVVAGDQQLKDLLALFIAAIGQIGPPGRGEQQRHALANHRPMEGEHAEAVGCLADQHAVAIEGR